MSRRKMRLIRLFLFLLSIWALLFSGIETADAQKKVLKSLIDSTKGLAKQYKLEAKRSLDSFQRVQKFKRDSIKRVNNPDTVPFKKNFRFGIDLGKPINRFFNQTQTDFEISVDYHAKERFFYAGELGFESVNYKVPLYYNYTSTGEYIKAGFDYGIFKVTKRNDNNLVYTGVRLGIGNVSYKADSIKITEGYFGNTQSATIQGTSRGFWLEFVFGTKVEISPKLFLGWSIRLDSRLNNLTNQQNYPVRIPGYGDSSSGQSFNYTYSIFYSF